MKTRIFMADDDQLHEFVIDAFMKHHEIGEFYEIEYFKSHYNFMLAFNPAVDLVVLDISMEKNITALDTIKYIYSINANCYILLMSGETRIEALVPLWNEGANAFVLKAENSFEKLFALIEKYHTRILKNKIELKKDIKILEKIRDITTKNTTQKYDL